MMPLSALLTGQNAPASAEAPAANGAVPPETADFGTLLGDLASAAGTAGATPANATPGGKSLPVTGKILPPGLAEPAPGDAAVLAEGSEPAGEAQSATPQTSPEQMAPPFPVALLAAPVPAQPALDAPRPEAGGGAPPAPAPLPPAPPRLAPATDQPASVQPVLVVATAGGEQVRALPEAPRYAPPPRLAATFRERSEGPASPRAIAGSALTDGLAGSAVQPASALLVMPAAVPSAAPQALATSATAPLPPAEAAIRPHDFGQLIDRLVAAREAIAPQAVSLTLAHAEFGRIDLSFANNERGLSVALASPDPDFARAVQAAAPPAPASADPGTPRQSGGQSAPHDGPASQPHGQPAGNGSERRDGRAAARPDPNPAPPRRETSGGETGIFA